MNVKTKFDLWLVRFSYIAQIAILFITVFTLFYTVVPLYQNAALQESIAKKELEMKELKSNIDRLNADYTRQIVNSFVFQVGKICSPSLTFLLKPVVVSSVDVDERIREDEKRINEYKDALNINIYNCLTSAAKNSSLLSKLNAEDFSRVLSNIDSIEPNLNKIRANAQKNLNNNNKLKEIGILQIDKYKVSDKNMISLGMTKAQLQRENDMSALVLGADDVFYNYGNDVMMLIKNTFINFQ